MNDVNVQRWRRPAWEAPEGDGEGRWVEKRLLATALRELADILAVIDAPEGEVRAAAEQANALVESLGRHPRYKTLDGFAEASMGDHVDALYERSPISGLSNALAPPLRVWQDGDRIRGEVTFGDAYEGPPGHVHGGYIAAVFDEVLGFAQTLTERPGMTAGLNIAYKRPVPLRTTLELVAQVERIDGRKIFTKGTLGSGGGVLAEGEGLFISIDAEQMQRYIDSLGHPPQEGTP